MARNGDRPSLWKSLKRGVSGFFQRTPVGARAAHPKRRLEPLESQVRANPQNDHAMLTLAQAYDELGYYAEAAETYAYACELFERRGYTVKALAVLHRIVELVPASREASRRRAQLLETLGRNREAAAAYEATARLASREGDLAQAQRLMDKAHTLLPNKPLTISGDSIPALPNDSMARGESSSEVPTTPAQPTTTAANRSPSSEHTKPSSPVLQSDSQEVPLVRPVSNLESPDPFELSFITGDLKLDSDSGPAPAAREVSVAWVDESEFEQPSLTGKKLLLDAEQALFQEDTPSAPNTGVFSNHEVEAHLIGATAPAPVSAVGMSKPEPEWEEPTRPGEPPEMLTDPAIVSGSEVVTDARAIPVTVAAVTTTDRARSPSRLGAAPAPHVFQDHESTTAARPHPLG